MIRRLNASLNKRTPLRLTGLYKVLGKSSSAKQLYVYFTINEKQEALVT